MPKDLYTNVHRNFICISQKLVPVTRPVTDEWLSKLWYIHIVEDCEVVKRNENTMTHETHNNYVGAFEL